MLIDIKVPYTTRPTMLRRSGSAFSQAPNADKVATKRQELAQHGNRLWGVSEPASQSKLIERAAAHCGKTVTDNIVDLALCFQEDFAVMHQGRLAAVCFCFPSGWTPRERLGYTLAEIHQPVADGADLVRMSARLAQTMADPVLGRFQRQVWTVTANPCLSNLPQGLVQREPTSIDDLYLRWENQTTEPLGDGATSLFFVDVNVVPLITVWSDLGARIVDSVNSMTDAVLQYKNLHGIKSLLNSFTK